MRKISTLSIIVVYLTLFFSVGVTTSYAHPPGDESTNWVNDFVVVEIENQGTTPKQIQVDFLEVLHESDMEFHNHWKNKMFFS